MATQFDEDSDIKKSAGVESLNKYACEYELQSICEMFPAMRPEDVLNGDDTFYTKHLLSSLEKSSFEKKYIKLKQKK